MQRDDQFVLTISHTDELVAFVQERRKEGKAPTIVSFVFVHDTFYPLVEFPDSTQPLKLDSARVLMLMKAAATVIAAFGLQIDTNDELTMDLIADAQKRLEELEAADTETAQG